MAYEVDDSGPCFGNGADQRTAHAAEPAPKLIVAISGDQFGVALLEQWRGNSPAGSSGMAAGSFIPAAIKAMPTIILDSGDKMTVAVKDVSASGARVEFFRHVPLPATFM